MINHLCQQRPLAQLDHQRDAVNVRAQHSRPVLWRVPHAHRGHQAPAPGPLQGLVRAPGDGRAAANQRRDPERLGHRGDLGRVAEQRQKVGVQQ